MWFFKKKSELWCVANMFCFKFGYNRLLTLIYKSLCTENFRISWQKNSLI